MSVGHEEEQGLDIPQVEQADDFVLVPLLSKELLLVYGVLQKQG